MADDFDQTQALFLDEFEQDTDEDDQKDKRPVAHLKVACQKGFPETTFPLYEGNNVIGRHEDSCSVCIPLKALSREHACIEIKGDSFLIFDKSSRNKTKRNKLYLTPEVRYELKNGDTLIFGDVEGKFVIGSQMDDDGSETGSESEYQTANDKDVTVELDEEEYDSDNSVDLLQPTQAYHTKKTGKSLIADDSLLEKESTVLVTETPGPKKKEIRTCPVIEDSGSETEDETSKNVPPTLVLNEESDVEESLLSGPTQAFTDFRVNEPTQTFVAESDTEDEDSKKKILQYAATQAYLGDESVIQDTQETKDDEIEESEEEDVSHLFTSSTLACDIDDFPSDQQVMADETAEFEQETLAVMAEATQAVTGCDPTLVVTGDDATQAVTGDDATQAVSGDDATQAVSGDDATQAASGDVPTLVVTGDDETQAVTGDDATQAVSGDVPTLVVTGDDETQAVTGDDATQAVCGDDATQAVSGDDATQAVMCDDATQAVMCDDATQAVSGDDATQAVSGDDTTEDIGSHANTTQRDSVKQGVTGEEDVGATQVFPEEAATEYELDERVQEGRPLVDIPTTASEDCASVVNFVAVTEKMEVVGQTETMAVDATLVIQDAVIEGKKSKGRGRQKKLPKDSTETKSEGRGGQIGKSVLQSDQADSSSQETDDGSVRRSGRAKRKSFRMVEMEESMDDMKGIDKSIRRGEDYSPEPEADSPKKSSGKKGNPTKLDQDFVADPVPHSDPNVTPLPNDVIEKTETQFLKTLPALQGKDAPQVKENIQVGTMDTDLPKPGMEEATQAYSLDVEDTILSNEGDRDEGDITLPIEDVLAATQPYSMEEEVIADSEEIDKPALISIPSRSPLKPAIRSPEKKRDKSPSPKRVQFAVKKTPSSSTTGSENSEAGAEAKSPTTNEIKAALVKKVIMRRKEEANEDEAIEKTQATTRGRRGKKVEPTAESENREAYLKEKPAITRGRKRKSTTVTNNVEPVDNKAEEIEEKPTTTRGRKRKSTTVTNNVEPVDNKAEEIEEKPTTTRGQKRKSTTVTNNVEPVDNKAGEMEEKNTDPVPETSGISDASENTMLTGAAAEEMSSGNSTIEKSPKISVEEKAAEETVKEKTVGDSVKEKSAEETIPVETEVENKNKRTAGRRSNVGKRQARGKKSSNQDEGKEAHVSNEADENEAKINEINDVETNEKKELKVGVKGRSRVSTAKTNITIGKDEDNKISESLASSSKEVVIEAVETSRPVGRRGRGAKKNSAINKSSIKNDTLSTLDNEGNDSTSTSQDIQYKEPKHSRRSEVSSPSKHDINSAEPKHSRRSNNSASSSQDIQSEEPKRSRRSKNLGPATQDVHSDEPKRNRRSNDSASASQDNHSDEPKDSRRSKNLSPAKQDKESDQPKSSRQSRSSVSSSQESVQSGKEVKITKSVKKGKILKNDEESANDTENTEMQNESRASRSTRRGHHGDVKNNSKPEVSEQSADIVDTSNVNDTIEKPVKRRGRTKVGQNDKDETDSESSQNSKTSQRSSSQPPNKSQSQPTGRRGRMSVQPVSNNKNDEAMQPPKTVGRRGKTDTQSDKTTFNSSSRRSSRQTRTTMNDNETVESESIKDDSSESSQDKDFVTDAKSVGNKRKRDSSVSSNGRKSQATKRTKTEDDDLEISGGADGKDTTKTTSRKRAREQESQESPVKKKEPKVETPKRSSTVGVSSPSLRRKSVDPSKPKVLFTGVIDEHGQKVIKDLGGDVASSVNECTHLVTDKIRRTVKFLCCLARGIPIVTLQWIESCKQSAMFVDCNKFAVKDSATEKQYKFSLSRSLEKARDASLLQGYKIHVTKSVKPEPSQMAEIITCAGGEYLTSMPKKGGDNIVIISCADDSSLCKAAVKAGIPVVSSEFILTGILKQETSIKQYTLNSEEEINTSIRGRR